ncbi:protein D1-like [Bicyclus anynana]|uniref:Protein D1-like n=1 Tax=Bicyclus anynana TaxID=110368 RepID=A0ABM3LXV2_BICAN|nr:protein D1-like [Bicyclus anynana]
MRVLLVCVAVALLSSPVELRPRRRRPTVADAFNDAEIPKILNITAPKTMLDVCYENAAINLGNQVNAGDTIGELEINFPGEPGCLYTLIVLSTASASSRSLDLSTGCEVVDLLPASPIPGTGPHTYIFLLFQQPDEIDTLADDIVALNTDRMAFNIADFVDNYCLQCPVAGNFFVTEFQDQDDD